MSQIDIEKLKSIKTIYSHSFCPDGLAAAMICKAAYASIGLFPEIYFIQYDTMEHLNLVAAPGQMFVDMSPPVRNWEDWIPFSPIVLDHHDTMEEVTRKLGIYGDANDSGASLAFKHVMKPLLPLEKYRNDLILEKWARFAWLSMIRDTWQEEHADWRYACCLANSLSFYNQNSLLISASELELDLDEMLRFGGVLLKKSEGKAFRLASTAVIETYKGKKFGFFNCTEKLISETAHELINNHDCDIAVGYFQNFEGGTYDTHISFRSKKKNGVPVNKMAELIEGGGGHLSSAGFRLKNTENLSFVGLKNLIYELYTKISE
ncbi:MAG: DHH family phosphoesterase [Lentisphaeria bacterium]|jgi:nanoRNase/pAp phosphatase (c-di-AMP/oligoRNAs hydrolase)